MTEWVSVPGGRPPSGLRRLPLGDVEGGLRFVSLSEELGEEEGGDVESSEWPISSATKSGRRRAPCHCTACVERAR